MDRGARTVRLVLCRGAEVVGALEPFAVATPWWPDAAGVVDGARRHHGLDVTVLRLLATNRPEPHGGAVTYLGEVEHPPRRSLERWPGDPLAEHPLRQTWARPGGPAADLAWADATLAQTGTSRRGTAVQVRSWNLSSLWQLPIDGGMAWLKVVPPFFAHEGAVIARIRIGPPLLAVDGPRVLLAHVPGDDLHDPSPPQLLGMIDVLVELQAEWAGRIDELLRLGAPDWRAAPLAELVGATLAATAHELDRRTLTALEPLIDGLASRMGAVAACGIPNSIVHGDFHGGNVRSSGDRVVVLDWGDSGVGHPLLDHAAATAHLDAASAATVNAAWAAAWRAAVPGSDPARAARLLAPVAALRQAVIYRGFLDRIEPSEHPYHRRDPARWIRRAAQLAAVEKIR